MEKMTSTISIIPSTFESSSSSPLRPFLSLLCNSFSSPSSAICFSANTHSKNSSYLFKLLNKKTPSQYPSLFHSSSSFNNHVCRAAEYQFPDPIPEFAESETEKFRNHLLKELSKKDTYGDSIEEVVGICTEIFSTFLHTEYGGPGTLLVLPFIDMADTLNERGLPGGPQAARAAVKWAQVHVDKDWKEWTNVTAVNRTAS
ncbi:protein PLASTID REDOX INSENSITIVE 2, chloroplastic [Cornus florida]|uniref:protein PLASTID REDOX INSENSITIVE 2, chloroplastic n=1 Tax=Cornus florida TaxID=4283 RepID=UPI00289E21A4|nr:protein PLASTID REDOX INSENSITIVE 2, chloroplastic [Cornus florida]